MPEYNVHNSKQGNTTVVIFSDIQQAFDFVWNEGLKYKLLQSCLLHSFEFSRYQKTIYSI